jgi:hypothetical protein
MEWHNDNKENPVFPKVLQSRSLVELYIVPEVLGQH